MSRVRVVALAFTIEEIERVLSLAGIDSKKQDEIVMLLLQREGREITYDEEQP